MVERDLGNAAVAVLGHRHQWDSRRGCVLATAIGADQADAWGDVDLNGRSAAADTDVPVVW